jgi:hypothetical protein
MPSYDPSNIFAKILRGELPCHRVYEDDKTLAFLDIMPRAPGHTLVLPKTPARNLLDIDPADLAHVMQVAQKIAKAAMKVFDADGITVQQFTAGERERRSEPVVGPGAQVIGGAAGLSRAFMPFRAVVSGPEPASED